MAGTAVAMVFLFLTPGLSSADTRITTYHKHSQGGLKVASKSCSLKCAVKNAGLPGAAFRVSATEPCTCELIDRDSPLGEPSVVSSGSGVVATKNKNVHTFDPVKVVSNFNHKLPLNMSSTRLEVLLTPATDWTLVSLELCIDGSNKPVHISVRRSTQFVVIDALLNDDWRGNYGEETAVTFNDTVSNITLHVDHIGLTPVWLNSRPITAYNNPNINALQAKYLSVHCSPSCGLRQIGFEKTPTDP